ncbi:hypothetical protein ACROYT_G012358 [Oculina patagonica]
MEAAKNIKNFPLEIKPNGKLALKKNHDHYYQVQGQMFITGYEWCDYVVWTPSGIHIERIAFDNDFWQEKMFPNLKWFYFNCLLPEIASPRHPQGLSIREPVTVEVRDGKRKASGPSQQKSKKYKSCVIYLDNILKLGFKVLDQNSQLNVPLLSMAAQGNAEPPNGDVKGKICQIKLVILGGELVGKSSFVLRFVKGRFYEYQEATVGAAFLTMKLCLDDTTVKFEIWDTAGKELYSSLAPMYFKDARAAIVVYDITDHDTFGRAKTWVKELQRQASPNIVKVLAGNKADLSSKRMVEYEDAQSYAEENGLLFMETSAKTGMNVNEIFLAVGKKVLRQHSATNETAGKSKKTDTSATFITQARRIFGKVKGSKPSGRKDDQDVTVQHEEGAVSTGKVLNGDPPRQLNDQEQLREKELQEANFQAQLREKDQENETLRRQLTRMEQQLRGKYLELGTSERLSREMIQRLTNLQEQLHEKDLQENSLNEQLREKSQQEENSRGQLVEMGRQLTNLQGQLREKEDEAANLHQQVSTLEGQLRTKYREVNELEITLSTARQALTEQQRQQSPDWVISRDQIQLTDKLLGRGGWGSVVEGKYCGCAVAVKQIHELILSPHNRSLFEREMDIASKCRHPCLLQFIGATNDEGSPLFLTELMESSLRTLLEQRPLSATEVSVISLDVARALSYLHQKTPSPIIHRDISSANVLLWRQGDQWRGKVSDYGTANFMQHTMTVGPGAMIYIAPEALTSNQTVKVDVYSFGVLLCEMCIRELPDPEKRDQQIVMVTNHVLRALIRGCVQTEPGARPNMEEIIEELEEPV